MKKATILRTALLILTLLNTLLVFFGKEKFPFTEDDVYQVFTYLTTAYSALNAWWYNNSFTKPAQEADKYLEMLKYESDKEGVV